MTPTARQQVSEMTEMTETTLARTFGWETPEAALYRDCPTAFWLAPDSDGVLAPPPPGPLPPQVFTESIDKEADMVSGMRGGILRALLAAGPIFTASALLLIPNGGDTSIWNALARAAISVIAFPLTVPVGGVLALLPVLAGVLTLGTAGESIPTLRKPTAWALTGGVMGAALSILFDAEGAVGLALIATAIACAAIARHVVTWQAPQPA